MMLLASWSGFSILNINKCNVNAKCNQCKTDLIKTSKMNSSLLTMVGGRRHQAGFKKEKFDADVVFGAIEPVR